MIFNISSTSLVTATSLINSNVKQVTPEELGYKLGQAVNMMTSALSGLVVPLLGFALLIGIIVYIAGSLSHSKTAKTIGAGGIIGSLGGYLIYILAPTILGFLTYIAQIFRQ